jgi:Transposase
MDSEKYIGLDVHQATISVAVMDATGKVVMESILETKAATILQFFAGLRGTLSVTFEEGTCAAWLYDLLKPHVDKLVVCNPRKNALLKDGNKSDGIDACKLAGAVTRQPAQAGLPWRSTAIQVQTRIGKVASR